ncbi:hypothetical protein RRG08_056068 [Elysia crispata]|uniref:Uncharacterized protein n=1 Tax=Elysia crispata TaxID=231223 RepID=A0AAE1DD70_9GAST|nr:hypothetical protein RRG08_056068 [Elysia crispata]
MFNRHKHKTLTLLRCFTWGKLSGDLPLDSYTYALQAWTSQIYRLESDSGSSPELQMKIDSDSVLLSRASSEN